MKPVIRDASYISLRKTYTVSCSVNAVKPVTTQHKLTLLAGC